MLNVAVISPLSPGGTSSFWVCAVVQPQEACTDLKCTGVLPAFWYLKWPIACLSLGAGCSSIVVCSHFSSARAPRHMIIDRVKARSGVFIFWNRSALYNEQPPLAKPEVRCQLMRHI